MQRLHLTLPITIVFATGLLAQDQQPVIKAGARLVQFSVIVRDKNGPIADLKKEDFTILDHGRAREIAVFHMDSRHLTNEAKPAALPANVFTNRVNDEPNSTILLFDAVNTRIPDQSYARLQIIKFIESLRPSDKLGIYYLGKDLRVVHDFSSDTGSLLEAVKAMKVRVSEADGVAIHASMDNQLSAAFRGRFALAFNAMLENLSGSRTESEQYDMVGQTAEAFIAIARSFARVPGRKNLVWVSSGYPIALGRNFDRKMQFDAQVDSASRTLIDANIAV